MHQTLDEIRREGLNALRERLGRSGLVRFLQQFELGSGDYARERHDWVDHASLDQIEQLAGKRAKKKVNGGRNRGSKRK